MHPIPHISLNPGSSIMNNFCCLFSPSEKEKCMMPVPIQILIYSFQCTTLPEKVGAVLPRVFCHPCHLNGNFKMVSFIFTCKSINYIFCLTIICLFQVHICCPNCVWLCPRKAMYSIKCETFLKSILAIM